MMPMLIERTNALMQERIARSFTLASREERRARLRAVVALSVELERVRAQQGDFAMALGEGVIEAVIEGDWREAREFAGDLTFEHEPAHQVHAPAWSRFVELARMECLVGEKRQQTPVGDGRKN